MNAVQPPERQVLPAGLTDPVHGTQRSFRVLLDAMARPGRIHELDHVLAAPPPAPLQPAAAAILMTLCDVDTPVWLSPEAAHVSFYLRFHCGATITADQREASFALVADAPALPPLRSFELGSDEYPDRSTTLIIQVSSLAAGSGAILTGPGIHDHVGLTPGGLGAAFWAERVALQELFPRGLDIVFVCETRVAALPRSTIVEV